MPKALIAGGSGFIGSHLCSKLINNGYIVYCVDNLITGNKTNINNLLDNPGFFFFRHDITTSLTNISARFEDVDYIFHLASPASPNINNEKSYMNLPIETMLANSLGTYNLLLLAKEKNSKFLFASTSEVYGNPAVSPQPESYFGNVSPNGKRSVYDEGKRFGEALTFAFLRKYDTDARIIRIFNTYGPNMQKDDGRVISNFINQAIERLPITVYGQGSQTRSFCYIDDMIDGIMSAMLANNTKGEVINLGNPDERTIKEIAAIVKELTGAQSQIINEPLPDEDPERRKPDIEKAKKILQWEPKISLEDGLKRTIEYFRNI
ncbi:SDR family oxidoreductase [Patescibacteria group bacterium]|nr:SDR family oxidoreductase [Patescibacteria group bacterium]MBU4098845.1 SDR family oxidoreductase [Patescibacteria group bacterium]